MSIRVLLVDDHSVVRQGLELFLDGTSEIEVIGEAANGREALDQAARLNPDVVLMDLLMPVMDGITAIKEFKTRFPEIQVLALTSVLEDASVSDAIKAGATGYLLKNTEADELRRAVLAAAQGQVQLSPEAAERLMKDLRSPSNPDNLTERELEVLCLVAKGFSNSDIAKQLYVNTATVKTHVSHVLSKLGVKSRIQAAVYAWQTGMVESPRSR